MTLYDLLTEIPFMTVEMKRRTKVGCATCVITSSNDGLVGTQNLMRGHYFICNATITEDTPRKEILYQCGWLPEEWLDRQVATIVPVWDITEFRTYLQAIDARKNITDPVPEARPLLNICVYGEKKDRDIWNETNTKAPFLSDLEIFDLIDQRAQEQEEE